MFGEFNPTSVLKFLAASGCVCMKRKPSPAVRLLYSPACHRLSLSVRLQHSTFQRGFFTTEMAAKVCRTVLLLTRSSGAVVTGLPALAISSQRHHQHIRSVSRRTWVRRDVGQGRAVTVGCSDCSLMTGLAKEVTLTSVINSFLPCLP